MSSLALRCSITQLAVVLALASGCHDAGSTLEIGVRVAALSSCSLKGVEARLSLPQQSRVCKLTLNSKGDAFEGTCSDVQPGSGITAILEYLVTIKGTEVTLARAQRKVEIDPDNEQTKLSFAAGDLKYAFDEDSDGVKNIDEHCLGRDPVKADAPSFTGTVAGEPGAVGASKQLHLIGERIKIVGSNFPPAERVSASFGPLLDDASGTTAVKPLKVTGSEIELQIPAGLDVSGDVELKLDALGTKWSKRLKVARLLAVVTGLKASHVALRPARGGYTGQEADKAAEVCADPTYTGSGDSCSRCGAWVHQISSDGRYLLMICVVDEKTGTQPIQVMELPTGKYWSGSMPQVTAIGTPRFVAKDSHVALADVDSLSFHRFDAASRKLGAAEGKVTIKGFRAMAVGGKDREELYLFSRSGGLEQVRRLEVKSDAQGKLSVAAKGTLDLKVACPSGSLPNCGLEWSDTISAVGPGQVVLARPDLDKVDFIDFTGMKVTSASQPAPRTVAVPPRSRKQIFVSSLDTETGGLGLGVCKYDKFGAAAFSKCEHIAYTAGTQALLLNMVIPPEEQEALATFTVLLSAWLKRLDLFTLKFSQAVPFITPSSLVVQP